MTYVASVLNPHGVRLGNSIDSHPACEFSGPSAYRTTPMCAPAYHHSPWASILTDMGTYNPWTNCKLQTNSHCGAE
jgi:hypothetical protein